MIRRVSGDNITRYGNASSSGICWSLRPEQKPAKTTQLFIFSTLLQCNLRILLLFRVSGKVPSIDFIHLCPNSCKNVGRLSLFDFSYTYLQTICTFLFRQLISDKALYSRIQVQTWDGVFLYTLRICCLRHRPAHPRRCNNTCDVAHRDVC